MTPSTPSSPTDGVGGTAPVPPVQPDDASAVRPRWRRWLVIAGLGAVFCYLGLATTLWGYYSLHRKISGVHWIDVVVLTRFGRVQEAIGIHHLADAKRKVEAGEQVPAFLLARVAAGKAPRHWPAQEFLASFWERWGRPDDAIRALENAMTWHAAKPELQRKLVSLCLEQGRFADVLRILRVDLPAHGQHPLDGEELFFQLAEVVSVLETAGVPEAEAAAARRPRLLASPEAAPLLARIDADAGRLDAGLQRLRAAREQAPKFPEIHDALVGLALRAGKRDEAQAAARKYAEAFPGRPAAGLSVLRAFARKEEPDRAAWMQECARYLIRFRNSAQALSSLARLAASEGWTDLTYLLYLHSLQNNLSARDFAGLHVGSLVANREFAAADSAWRQFVEEKVVDPATNPVLGAIVAMGGGREEDAFLLVERLQRETAADLRRRQRVAAQFSGNGFPQLAERLQATP